MAEKYVKETTDDFLSRLNTTVCQGYTSLSIAFGLQSGLFKTLIEHHQTPKTSQELADAADMKERYVREWLGVMVNAHIVNIDPATEKYHLPANRIPGFEEGLVSGQTATLCIGIPLLNEAYNEMLKCIRNDGPLGVSCSKYTAFHEIVGSCNDVWFQNELCQNFVPSLPVLEKGLEMGIRVLDLGCGLGGAARCFAENYPKSKITGLDISEEAIGFAVGAAKSKNLTNVEYVCADATAMPADWTDMFDYLFMNNVIHDLPRPDKVLEEVKRVLKPDGMMSFLEPDFRTKQADNFDKSNAVRAYTFSLFHCLPISCQFPDSMALGACWGREHAVKLFQSCGFTIMAITKHWYRNHFWCMLPTKQ